MKGLLFGVIVFAFSTVRVSAQTLAHPCDATVPAQTLRLASPAAVVFCVPYADAQGQPMADRQFRVTVDGRTVFNGPCSPTGIGELNAAGLIEYVSPPVSFKRGTHTVRVFVRTAAGESVSSVPVLLWR